MAETITVDQHHLDHDGQRLGIRFHGAAEGAGPLALLLPAMGTPAAYYDGFAGLLVERGLAVAVADLRGVGASTPRPDRAARYGYAELVSDVPVLLDAATARLGADRPVLLIGHSLGGHAASLHLAVHRSPTSGQVAGLVLVASGAPHHRLYPGTRGLGVRVLAPVIRAASTLIGWWPGHRFGFGGRQARGVMRDWAHVVRTGRFPELLGVDTERALAGVTLPLLSVSVEGDELTPAPTVDLLTAKFTGARGTERHHYTVAESGAPMDHFRWTRAGAPLADRIARFAASLPAR